jgi:hypothetical protein
VERLTASLVIALVVLTSCGSSRPYTSQDLKDVKSIYASLLPVYLNFRSAYARSDWTQMTLDYRAEQVLCARVDVVDVRDTIDPNANLFQASVGLDNFCNDIESAYAGWEKSYHRAYDKRVVPSYPENAFKGSQLSLKQMNMYLRRPAALS